MALQSGKELSGATRRQKSLSSDGSAEASSSQSSVDTESVTQDPELLSPEEKAAAKLKIQDLERTTNLPKDVKVNDLDFNSMYAAIGPNGIYLDQLEKRLGVDETNFHLFLRLLRACFNTEVRYLITRPPKRLNDHEVAEIHKAARRATIPLSLGERQRVIATLCGTITITRNGPDELIRGRRCKFPHKLYRTFNEKAATYCCFTTDHNFIQRQELDKQIMRKGIAFQAMGSLDIKREFTPTRIQRHLQHNEVKDPSALISAYDNLGDARLKAQRHSRGGVSKILAERIAIAEIDTSNLVAVTIHAEIEECIETTLRYCVKPIRGEIRGRRVAIPAYVDEVAWQGRETRDAISLDQLEKSKASGWLSASELCRSDLGVCIGPGHKTTCLAFEDIASARITNVWPWDGKQLYLEKTEEEIRSLADPRWLWNKNSLMWQEDLDFMRNKQEEAAKTASYCLKDEGGEGEHGPAVQLPAQETAGPATAETESIESETTEVESATPDGMVKLGDFSDDEDEFGFDSELDTSGASSGDATKTPAKRKKGAQSNLNHRPKRARIGNAHLPKDGSIQSHRCPEWCAYGYWNSEPEYTFHWEKFLNSQESSQDSSKSGGSGTASHLGTSI